MQVPEHLQCPDGTQNKFMQYQEAERAFFNCARTWCMLVGILDKEHMQHGAQNKAKHTKEVPQFMNRLLGLNLEQQSIIFRCAARITPSSL